MTRKGVWNLQQVRDKYLQSLWEQYYQLWVGGRDSYGGLGQNAPATNYSSPVQVPGTNWNALAVGQNYNMAATKTDGTLWTWGNGNNGVLGINQPGDTDYSSPKQVPGTTWGSEIVNSGSFVLSTRTDGTLWAWGNNNHGQLGLNSNVQYSSPVQVGSETTWATGNDKLGAGGYRIIAIKTDGTLWSWGRGDYGQLGHNDLAKYSSPTQIPGTNWSTATCGAGDFSGGVKTNGELWMWGKGDEGQLGQNTGDPTRRSSPVQVPGTTWKQLACNESASAAVKTDGTLWTWGGGDNGMLGNNTTGNPANRSSPVQIPGTTWDKVNSGGDCFTAIRTDGTLWTWGISDYGQLMQDNETAYSSPTQIPGSWTLDNVSHGRNHDVFGAIRLGLTPSQL